MGGAFADISKQGSRFSLVSWCSLPLAEAQYARGFALRELFVQDALNLLESVDNFYTACQCDLEMSAWRAK